MDKYTLKSIDSDTPLHEILRVASLLESMTLEGKGEPLVPPVPDYKQQNCKEALDITAAAPATLDAAVLVLRANVTNLRKDIEQITSLLDIYQKYNDRKLVAIKDAMEISVYNLETANHALQNYDMDWFSSALLSVPAKIDLASFLLDLTSRYTSSGAETLKSIVKADPEVLRYISVPHNDE